MASKQLPPFYVKGFEKPFVVKPTRYDNLVATEGVPLYHRTTNGMTFVGSERQLGYYITKFHQLQQYPLFYLTENANPAIWNQDRNSSRSSNWSAYPDKSTSPPSPPVMESLLSGNMTSINTNTSNNSLRYVSGNDGEDLLDRIVRAAFPTNLVAQQRLKMWTETIVLQLVSIVMLVCQYVRFCLLALGRQNISLQVNNWRFELSTLIDLIVGRDSLSMTVVDSSNLSGPRRKIPY